MDLACGGAGHDADGLPVDDEPEGVVLGGDGDDLARVDQADLDLLGGDHDAAAGGDPPLHRHRARGRERGSRGLPGAAQPVPVPGGNRAGHGPRQFPVTGDDHHLGAVHPHDDPLPGQLVADIDLGACQADQAAGVDRALDLHGRAGTGQ